MYTWHLETWLSGGLDSARFGLDDFGGPVQPKWFHDSINAVLMSAVGLL